MGLERVTEDIRARAKSAAESELQRARSEASALAHEAEKQAADVRAKRTAEAQQAVESLRRRELAAAELDVKKLQLNAQKEVLAKLREATLKRLSEMPADKRVQHLQALLKRATVQRGKVYVSERDVEAAKKAGIDVAGTIHSVGGLIVESPDGTTREDLTYESLFDEVWAESLPKVAQGLFGKE